MARKGRVKKDTKTHRDRHIAIPEVAWNKLSLPEDPNALLFPGKAGDYITKGEYRWAFDEALKAVGLSGFVPHDLRHACATLAIQSGANVKAVQHLLGHATATMTLDLYGHLFSDDVDRVADALDKAAAAADKPGDQPDAA